MLQCFAGGGTKNEAHCHATSRCPGAGIGQCAHATAVEHLCFGLSSLGSCCNCTNRISVELRSAAKLPALQLWLGQHGRQLASLKAGQRYSEQKSIELQLPCAMLLHLTSMDLTCFLPHLQLRESCNSGATGTGDAGQVAGAISSSTVLPRLQHVSLGSCTLNSTTTLLQLSSLTGMTELTLDSVRLPDSSAAHVQQLSGALAQLLQQLPHLHSLSLSSMEVDQSALVPLSTMQDLQDVSISTIKSDSPLNFELPTTEELLASLPRSLTRLLVAEDRMLPSLPADMARLSCLQELELRCAFHPAVLNGMGQLQRVITDDYHLLPDDDMRTADAFVETSLLTADLLTAVGQMQGLKQLSVTRGFLYCANLPAHSLTALTAASGLECLEWELARPLLLGAVQHMFPAGKQLPHLQTLSLVHGTWNADHHALYMTAADLSSISAACPALERLCITNALQPGEAHGLLMLPARCTHVSIGGKAMDDSTASVVTQLTQLHSLTWQSSLDLTDIGLEQLTALTALTSLDIRESSGLSKQLVGSATGTDPALRERDKMGFTLTTQDGRLVWQQLWDLCDHSPLVALHRQQQHKRDKARLQQVLSLRQQNLQLQQENAWLRQQLTTLSSGA